ncbi:hypothetical protein GCM10027568_19750 [Humibacter soli]
MRRTAATLLRSLADPGLLRLRAAAVTYVTALIGGVAAALVSVRFDLGASIVVLAVMLSITFTAERSGTGMAQRLTSLVVLPVAGIAAGAVAALLFTVPLVGDILFVIVVSGAIWIRRFGQVAARIGTLVSLPFITVLVVPAPAGPASGFVLWAAVVALFVALVSFGVQWLARATGVTPAPRTRGMSRDASSAPQKTAQPAHARPAAAQASTAPAAAAPTRTLPASTRMALQMAITLTAAFLLGNLVFGEHWFWVVLTAFIVASGNRGRGDVLYKGIHRTIGAGAGTVLAALLALLAPAQVTGGAAGATVIAIAVILALGLWLRPAGYGWWAAAMTAMLSLLHELTGTAADSAMLIRLVAIVVGGVLATAIAWWVVPVRTGDVLRRRTADALAALSDLLIGCIREPDGLAPRRAALDDALAKLEQLGPTLRLERAARTRSRAADHRADVIPAVRGCWASADAIAAVVERGHPLSGPDAKALGGITRRLGDYRRMLVGAPAPEPGGDTAAFSELGAAVDGLGAPLSTVARTAS